MFRCSLDHLQGFNVEKHINHKWTITEIESFLVPIIVDIGKFVANTYVRRIGVCVCVWCVFVWCVCVCVFVVCVCVCVSVCVCGVCMGVCLWCVCVCVI